MFPSNKTKIVCTIGPASRSPEVLVQLIRAGMNIARLNFSHGEFSGHARDIQTIRQAAETAGRPVAIMADLPGPKIRIGELSEEPIFLKGGQPITLTTETVAGTAERISVNFERLPAVVKKGDRIYINDGFIQLKVLSVQSPEIRCEVAVGGMIRSRKGLNIPDVDLGISAFTDHDRHCMTFALENGVDAVSQSFVESAADIRAVREAARQLGVEPFIIAKIERSRAVENLAGILDVADGIMVARGDLGVEIPIAKIPSVQKKIMELANRLNKPIITATQMLESMTANRLPTRAEATDVANAILDGTDCVMLSGESAVGDYPLDAVAMLREIATDIEPNRRLYARSESKGLAADTCPVAFSEVIASSVAETLKCIQPAAIITPTRSGTTARRISRFRLPVWIAAVSSKKKTCQELLFSYGVIPVFEPEHPNEWRPWIRTWLAAQEESGDIVVLTEGPSAKYPHRNNRMEIIDLKQKSE
ncbi:pyruvate kinase [Desulfosarcina ovata subsp. sediminis]|uniref:Pyruvate kinase n=1 Tax=Desulfosarcina ovata subsp. sediminis TaxID=885957 RepID=A0A5K7ZTV6_9BACT|nr:pyruvate kinase [Desulfosarcina ovata]BBO83630.1 pyruvate kinase [Desulfosarcina ovata subsp. sediminis]